jgi:hypothetical protein
MSAMSAFTELMTCRRRTFSLKAQFIQNSTRLGSVASPVIQATALGGRNLRMVWGWVTLCRASHRAFRTRTFRRTRTQTEVRNSDSDSGSDLRNRDFPTP